MKMLAQIIGEAEMSDRPHEISRMRRRDEDTFLRGWSILSRLAPTGPLFSTILVSVPALVSDPWNGSMNAHTSRSSGYSPMFMLIMVMMQQLKALLNCSRLLLWNENTLILSRDHECVECPGVSRTGASDLGTPGFSAHSWCQHS